MQGWGEIAELVERGIGMGNQNDRLCAHLVDAARRSIEAEQPMSKITHVVARAVEAAVVAMAEFHDGNDISRGVSGTARKAPGGSLSGDPLRGSASAPLSEGGGSVSDPPPPPDAPGILSVDPRASGSVVITASSGPITLHPDFAEEFALQLIRRATIVRLGHAGGISREEVGVKDGYVRAD